MKKKIPYSMLACMVIIAICFFAYSKELRATSIMNWWKGKWGEPQYGGSITYSIDHLMPNFDTYVLPGGDLEVWLETLFAHDWTLDRDVWGFNEGFVPDEYWKGHLAKDWEQTDPTTLTVHLRQGIHWQDKPPVNGREFTAYDVQSHYDRMLGKGDYTHPAPMYAGLTSNWDSVTATDKYTVVFKFKSPSAMAFQSIADMMVLNAFEPPEVAKLAPVVVGPPKSKGPPAKKGPPGKGGPPAGGNMDWKIVVGTGPWILTDYVAGSALSFVKNPNYWGSDERYTDNPLPYADKLKIIIISDISTSMAAVRTGKIDILPKNSLNWVQAKTLKDSNPELQVSESFVGEQCLLPRMDTAPFTDIRVRKALQMAINRKEIAQSYYGGTVDGKPAGYLCPNMSGYAFTYDDWPQTLKDEYSYNPEKTKELLAEASLDGVFTANKYGGFNTSVLISSSRNDKMLMQIIKSEFMDVGVDMEIEVMEDTAWESMLNAGKQRQMAGGVAAQPAPPHMTISNFDSREARNWCYTNDPNYDSLVDRFRVATTSAEAKQIRLQADRYAIEQHWMIVACPYNGYNVWKPYLKGYSGETIGWGQGFIWARLWIDQNLK